MEAPTPEYGKQKMRALALSEGARSKVRGKGLDLRVSLREDMSPFLVAS